jgi:hypothetical protein
MGVRRGAENVYLSLLLMTPVIWSVSNDVREKRTAFVIVEVVDITFFWDFVTQLPDNTQPLLGRQHKSCGM